MTKPEYASYRSAVKDGSLACLPEKLALAPPGVLIQNGWILGPQKLDLDSSTTFVLHQALLNSRAMKEKLGRCP